jgi:tripartite-type tricarboxylate transporter receptor subunit TctC
MRRLLSGIAAIAALFAVGTAAAQDYPSKPLRILVGFAPGGGGDILTRAYADALKESLGQPVVVENRAGANGILAAEMLAKAPPDGYTLGLAINSTVTNQFLYKTLSYDVWKDFVPVSLIANTTLVLACNPSLQAKNLTELIALAKNTAGGLNYGSPGNGSIIQMAMELMNLQAGIKMNHIPYKGGAPAMTAVLGGEVACSWFSIAQSLPQIKEGKLRPIAVGTAESNPTLPDVPPAAKAGVPGYAADTWFGYLAPAGTPAAIVNKLNAEFNRISRTPAMLERIEKLGAVPMYGTSAEFAAFMRAESDKWGSVIQKTGITGE